VVCISAKGCRVGRGAGGGGEGDECEGEKVVVVTRGESGRRLSEGGVLQFPTNLARVGLCGP
jgi:hypothetical protein